MLKIWGRRSSLHVQKLMWLIGELKLEHRFLPAGGDFGGLSDPEFARLNPNRLVPVVEDGGAAIWESHAILRYLGARYGNGRLWPEDPIERALSDRWMEWCQTTWQPAFLTGVFWGYYRTPEADRDHAAVRQSISRCSHLMTIVEEALGANDYLCGEALTVGEIPLATFLYRYFELDIDRPSLPRVCAWYERLRQRPAYREHVMLPFDDLKGRLSYPP